MTIRTKRVYDSPAGMDGYRVLVDRLWPRGIRKEEAALDEWCKDLAPSDDLRKWFGHDVKRWSEFARQYNAELDAKKDAVDEMVNRSRKSTITLLYAAKDVEHNNAAVLKAFIETHIKP